MVVWTDATRLNKESYLMQEKNERHKSDLRLEGLLSKPMSVEEVTVSC